MTQTETLLFEIGVEELPASYVEKALSVLPELFRTQLKQLRLAHSTIEVFGTPRRLAVRIQDLALHQPDLCEQLSGPPASVAFDKTGQPTKAAQAFADKIGCPVDQLARIQTPKGEYLAGERKEKGQPATALLPTMLADICGQIPFRKSMRWSTGDATFGRPIRWLIALLGANELPFSFAGVNSGRTTLGHRFLSTGPLTIQHPSNYVADLEQAHVMVNVEAREAFMMKSLHEQANAQGGVLVEDSFLVKENLNLVEKPWIVAGGFDKSFLELPEGVIVAVAKGHQRYFCVRDKSGKLANTYLAVAGTAERPDAVRLGNDRVMRARLADAEFFYREDAKVPMDSRFERLDGIVFQKRLGSVKDKVLRVERLVRTLGSQLGFDAAAIDLASRGAHLCKCDLVSLMVGEFPELQGEMGAEYALRQGEPNEVATIIREHYLPKGASDGISDSKLAALVGMADRLDTLVGCFAVGLSPTGATDPYALRRACLGILRIALHHGFPLSVEQAIRAGFAGFAQVKVDETEDQVVSKLTVFFRDRLRGLLVEGIPQDVVDACMASGHDQPTDVFARAKALAQLAPEVRSKVGEVFKRANNIAKEAPAGQPVSPATVSSDVHASETALFQALTELDVQLDKTQETRDFPKAFSAMAEFAPLLGSFFENVFVMTEDLPLRENRLRLMRSISERCSGIAHFNLLT